MKSFFSTADECKNKLYCATSVAIGKFDGIHVAHKSILKQLDKQGIVLQIRYNKDSKNIQNGELTPDNFAELFAGFPFFRIALKRIKDKNNIEFLDFIQERLPNLRKIVVGYDFRFGKDRLFYPHDLKRYFSGEIEVISEMHVDNLSVHSSLIKELLVSGNIQEANRLLGRDYGLFGKIIKGQGIGFKKLFATINIKVKKFWIPHEGVYAGYVILGDNYPIIVRSQLGAAQNPIFPAVIFIGYRLTTDKAFAIEAHLLNTTIFSGAQKYLFDYRGQLHSQFRRAGFFLQYKLRNNRKFDTIEQLRNQIANDITQAEELLKI